MSTRLRTSASRRCCKSSATGSKTACRLLFPWSAWKRTKATRRTTLERVSHRINALGQLYSQLSKANTVEAVDAATYLDELCRDLIASVHKEGGTSIVLKTDIESEPLPTDRAIPIGLIVNELVTNAVKYAFPERYKGHGRGDVKADARRASPDGLR